MGPSSKSCRPRQRRDEPGEGPPAGPCDRCRPKRALGRWNQSGVNRVDIDIDIDINIEWRLRTASRVCLGGPGVVRH
jgi:hypothetical protein